MEVDMAPTTDDLRVICGAHDRYPRAFRWRGQRYRVLALEGVRVVAHERRYRLATGEGSFELAEAPAGVWQVRRAPGPLSRFWARWQNAPRYPLPAWRRRSSRADLSLLS
jgi:hypothetical protein